MLTGAWVGALAGNLVQGLPNYSSKALKPKWERLNPAQGIKKLKTKVSPVEWARLLILLVVLVVVVWQTIDSHWMELLRSPGISIEASNSLLRDVLIRVLTYVVMTLIVLSIGDFFVQRHRHEKSLKQSKAEVKQDNKQLEGNPEVKAKVRAIQREQARNG